MPVYTLKVNGKQLTADVVADTPLLWVLRDHLGLVGTKYGCGVAQCGACTVHLNGNAVKSCVLPVSAVDVPQCGYCQAGQIMTAASLLNRKPSPNEEEIDTAMHGNICRCGAYHRIREAVKLASTKI